MKKKLIEKQILNADGCFTDYGLMLLARKDEEAVIALTIDIGNEVENMVKLTLARCKLEYHKKSIHADEVRQRMYVRMLTVYSERFKIERYAGADGFYVENWRTLDKEKLLGEYMKYMQDKKEQSWETGKT